MRLLYNVYMNMSHSRAVLEDGLEAAASRGEETTRSLRLGRYTMANGRRFIDDNAALFSLYGAASC